MESVDWARNKCPLSAMTGVHIKRVVYKENIRAFNKIWFISCLSVYLNYQSNHYKRRALFQKSTLETLTSKHTGTCMVTNA